MTNKKVFNCSNWSDIPWGEPGNCYGYFLALDDSWRGGYWEWTISEMEARCTDDDWYSDSDECQEAVKWVNDNLLKECPDLDPDEEVLIEVQW